MKKYVFITLFLFTIQAAHSQGVRMGLSTSPQVSWMTSDASSVKGDGAIMGFNFGLLTDFFFAERYSITTGVSINNTGGRLLYNDSLSFKTSDQTYEFGPGTSIKYRIQYIDVPLAFKLESNQIGYFIYYAQFGITNHFMVGATADIDSENISDVGCKDEINFFNMGYNIGIGSSYYFSKNTAITFGAVYTNGFIDMTNNDNKRQSDNATLRSVTLKLGLVF